jgi:hypothetical protein
MAYITEEIAPLAEPLLLIDVKNHLKVPVGVTADDTFIAELIQAAREEVEGYTGRSLVNTGYNQVLDSFPYFVDSVMSQMAYPPSYYSLPRYSTTLWNYSQMLKLLRSPLREVTRIDYVDSVTTQTLSLLPAPAPWAPNIKFAIGDEIQDSNGNLQEVTAVDESQANEDGTVSSGASTPVWNITQGGTTTDAGLTWTNQGLAPAGDFLYDNITCPGRIFPMPGQSWPPVLYVPNAVSIHYIAGYGNDGTAVPATLRSAMRILISEGYYNRELSVSGSISENPRLQRLLYRWKIHIKAATRG